MYSNGPSGCHGDCDFLFTTIHFLDKLQSWMKLQLTAMIWYWFNLGLLAAQATISTPTSSECNDCTRYGACKPPILNPPEKHPLIVTKTVTSTAVLVTNEVNTLTVAAPFYTETTTVMIRSTMTSTEVVVASVLTTTTQTFIVTIYSTITKDLIDDKVEYVLTTGVTTVGPFTRTSEKISTQIFTSYTLTTATRQITRVSRSTRTTFTTSLVYIYSRITESQVQTLFNSFWAASYFTFVVIVQTVPIGTNVVPTETSFITIATVTQVFTTSFITSAIATNTNPVIIPVPFTAPLTFGTTYGGFYSGVVTKFTPIVTELIN